MLRGGRKFYILVRHIVGGRGIFHLVEPVLILVSLIDTEKKRKEKEKNTSMYIVFTGSKSVSNPVTPVSPHFKMTFT